MDFISVFVGIFLVGRLGIVGDIWLKFWVGGF